MQDEVARPAERDRWLVTSEMVQVDAGKARESYRYPPMVVGMTVVAAGSYDANGVLLAELVWRAKQSPAAWSPDR